MSISRRKFIKTTSVAGAVLMLGAAIEKKPEKLFLLRYDTEGWDKEKMEGFFEKLVEVHRKYKIPATFFCQGSAILNREKGFRYFFEQVKNDPLFDIQDHSYSHIG